MDLQEIYNSSVATVQVIERYDMSEFTDEQVLLIDTLKTKCMEAAVLVSLLNKLQNKYPAINLDVELFLEGVQID
jgi:Cu/Ag efflux pump CusA